MKRLIGIEFIAICTIGLFPDLSFGISQGNVTVSQLADGQNCTDTCAVTNSSPIFSYAIPDEWRNLFQHYDLLEPQGGSKWNDFPSGSCACLRYQSDHEMCNVNHPIDSRAQPVPFQYFSDCALSSLSECPYRSATFGRWYEPHHCGVVSYPAGKQCTTLATCKDIPHPTIRSFKLIDGRYFCSATFDADFPDELTSNGSKVEADMSPINGGDKNRYPLRMRIGDQAVVGSSTIVSRPEANVSDVATRSKLIEIGSLPEDASAKRKVTFKYRLPKKETEDLQRVSGVLACGVRLGDKINWEAANCGCPHKFIAMLKDYQNPGKSWFNIGAPNDMLQICDHCGYNWSSHFTEDVVKDKTSDEPNRLWACMREEPKEVTFSNLYGDIMRTVPAFESDNEIKLGGVEVDYTLKQTIETRSYYKDALDKWVDIEKNLNSPRASDTLNRLFGKVGFIYSIKRLIENSQDLLTSLWSDKDQIRRIGMYFRSEPHSVQFFAESESEYTKALQVLLAEVCAFDDCLYNGDQRNFYPQLTEIDHRIRKSNEVRKGMIKVILHTAPFLESFLSSNLYRDGQPTFPTDAEFLEALGPEFRSFVRVSINDLRSKIKDLDLLEAYLKCPDPSNSDIEKRFDAIVGSLFALASEPLPVRPKIDRSLPESEQKQIAETYHRAFEKWLAWDKIRVRRDLLQARDRYDQIVRGTAAQIAIVLAQYVSGSFLLNFANNFARLRLLLSSSDEAVRVYEQGKNLRNLSKMALLGMDVYFAKGVYKSISEAFQKCFTENNAGSYETGELDPVCLENVQEAIVNTYGFGLYAWSLAKGLKTPLKRAGTKPPAPISLATTIARRIPSYVDQNIITLNLSELRELCLDGNKRLKLVESLFPRSSLVPEYTDASLGNAINSNFSMYTNEEYYQIRLAMKAADFRTQAAITWEIKKYPFLKGGDVFTSAQLNEMAENVGLTVGPQTVFRIDGRTIEEIMATESLVPNPNSPPMGLVQHLGTTHLGGGNLVSTTKMEGNSALFLLPNKNRFLELKIEAREVVNTLGFSSSAELDFPARFIEKKEIVEFRYVTLKPDRIRSTDPWDWDLGPWTKFSPDALCNQ